MVTANAAHFVYDVPSTGPVERGSSGGQFSYDALEAKGRRKAAPNRIVREDVHVSAGKRTKLQASARDLAKNFSIAAWMIRRHLDYCASFTFQAKTSDRGLNKAIEQLMEIQSRPLACDRGGRFSREKMFRQVEASRVLDGDIGMLRLRSGHTQLIESDCVRDPEASEKKRSDDRFEWVDGVQVDYAGLPRQYSVHGRKKGGRGYEFRRTVPAQNFLLYGFFDRPASDQVRGISPIVAALNNFRDVYDNIDYAQVKMKITQLFALALLRKSEAQGLNEALPTAGEQAVLDGEACEEDVSRPREFDLSGGPTVLDLDTDESVEVIESNTPATEFQSFIEIVLAVGLKSLDIPYSFYNERFTNYSGSRTAWLHYERSCGDRRADQIEARRRWTLWQLQRWIADGIWTPPSGQSIADIKFEWIPRGMPWWKPSEEIVGDIKAIGAGFDNPDRVCRERDRGDPRDNIDATLEIIKYALDQGKVIIGPEYEHKLNFSADFGVGAPEAAV